MKTNIITLNIGLNNNPITEAKMPEYLVLLSGMRLIAYEFTDSYYKGNPERTIIAMFETSYERLHVHRILEDMCYDLTQEVIAFTYNGLGLLAYNPMFEGTKMVFSYEQFKSIDSNVSKYLMSHLMVS